MKMIPLTQGKYAQVDDGDFDYINQRTWSLQKTQSKTYAATNLYNGKNNPVTMHRYLLGDTCKGMDVDHIDGDGLNNQRSNLRVCTRAENLRNRIKPKINNYKYKGVQPMGKKWRAIIGHDGRTLHLGMHNTEEEAARAYDDKARELFGKFANTNF